MVEFDFLGKDSIRYYNRVPVDKQAFKNLRLFVKDKRPSDDLFDRLTVSGTRLTLTYALYLSLSIYLSVCVWVFADDGAKQVSPGADGGTDCKGLSNLQRFHHSTGAT